MKKFFIETFENELSKLKQTKKIINIKKNTDKFIEFEKSKNQKVKKSKFIQINIKKNCELNLTILSKSLDFINLEINLEKGAKLNFSNNLIKNNYFKINLNLFENSKVDFKTGFYFKKETSYFKIITTHFEKNSNSNLEITGICENSKILNDGLIKIEKKAKNSKANLKIENLIYDNSLIYSEPILEIKNNEIKCFHKASISNIKNEILNFMKIKGFSIEDTKKLFIKSNFIKSFTLIQKEKIKKELEKEINKL
jgi:Fe-S cluster assembly scaffold protein SufB